MLRDLVMAGMLGEGVDIVHCHTWYTHLAGCLVKQLTGARLVLTTHSLEPHRPWKVEQLGTAYHASSWVERTAYQNADGVIAVSKSMRQDVHELYGVPFEKIRVIHNGIDLNQYRPTPDRSVLARYQIDPGRPYVLFVGRITRQKGIIHLVNAIKYFKPGVQVVLCAGAPDTPEIGREMNRGGRTGPARDRRIRSSGFPRSFPRKRSSRSIPRRRCSSARRSTSRSGSSTWRRWPARRRSWRRRWGVSRRWSFLIERACLCPSSRSGRPSSSRSDPDRFSRDLAVAVNSLIDDLERRHRMGIRSRERVEHFFGWPSIARFTLDFFWDLIQG